MAVIRAVGLAVGVLLAATTAANARMLAPRASSVAVVGWIFGALAFAAAALARAHPMDAVGARRIFSALGVSVAGFLILRMADVGALGRYRSVALMTVIHAAWVEESVFRIMLPRAFGALLAPFGRAISVPLAIAVSQALFAAGHFVPGTPRYGWPGAVEATRLAGAGFLLWVIASRAGLTDALVVHAALNLRATPPF